MKQIGLFFGSFNPIHIGHLAIANYMVEFEQMDELWFVVSPQNPFKEGDQTPAELRVKMVEMAIKDHPRLKAEPIELSLPVPSYTISTLKELHKKHPDCQFNLVMGADNIIHINQWKDADMILSNYMIYVYPRLGELTDQLELPLSCVITKAPIVEISSTQIRQWIKDKKQLPYFTPKSVLDFITTHNLYS